jgi:hypothetical protein
VWAYRQGRELWARGRPLPWSELVPAQLPTPIELFELHVGWDIDVPDPAWATAGAVLPCARPGPREILCTGVRVAPLSFDPDVPNWHDRINTIALAEAHSWEELSQRAAALVEQAAQPDARIEAELARLIAPGRLSTLQQLERLQRFVAREVRYVALEHGPSAAVPRRAGDTLEHRYGDCKDKVMLLVALALK